MATCGKMRAMRKPRIATENKIWLKCTRIHPLLPPPVARFGGFAEIRWALVSIEDHTREMGVKRRPRKPTEPHGAPRSNKIGIAAPSIHTFPLLCGFWRTGVAVARQPCGGCAEILRALGLMGGHMWQ